MSKSLEQCRKEHGTVWCLKFCGHEIVFKRPARAAWRKYRSDSVAAISGEGSRFVDGEEELAIACVVSHDSDELDAIFDAHGDVHCEVVKEVRRLMEGKEADQAKKYEPASPSSTPGT